jgi:uncharacterized membrane protein
MHEATSTPTIGPQAVRSSAASLRAYRLTAIDFLRGLAIVIMAIDHVRDFFMVGTAMDPMTDPNVSAGLFAAR